MNATQPPLFQLSNGPVGAASTQVTLPPFQPSSDTSRAAAISIAPHVGPMQRRVLDFIEDRGVVGATEEEIVLATGMRLQSVCARVNELAHPKKGEAMVRDSEERRRTTSGRWAVVWVSA